MGTDPFTKTVFEAFVEALIPTTLPFAQKLCHAQYVGASDLLIHEYIIWTLDHSISLIKNTNYSLSRQTAELLELAAHQLVLNSRNTQTHTFYKIPNNILFSALTPKDRLRSVTLLEQLTINPASLPYPFNQNPRFVLPVIDVINRLAMFGFYSEWSGYGTTRLNPPNNRHVESFPVSWIQVKYPGPSKGYHAWRGYLVDRFIE
ncbi:hypothetical protein [Neobacillus cucumis]|uniref:Uncharacterized protein n=1 Tax=Neobacillus cucumis TaxID=1740721 RepID=A0A2N5HDS5_9BACI|nr:hypothetical protein [Neobacillus cucumis]PLS03689.1 hypothetical protein CVD27_13535 [Neobacillus cucumis]